MTALHALPAGLVRHLAELSGRLGPLAEPLCAWLAGGFAVHYYTQQRLSGVVDIRWSRRIAIPPDMQTRYYTQQRLSGVVDIRWSRRIAIPPDMQTFEMDARGSSAGKQIVVMDGSFTDVMGSFPPDWEERSQDARSFGNMVLHVIDPVDLAVSKVARFSERNREDIQALAERGLIDPDTFAKRSDEALECYVGDLTFVRYNAGDATEIVGSAPVHPARVCPSPVSRPDTPEADTAFPATPSSSRFSVLDAARA